MKRSNLKLQGELASAGQNIVPSFVEKFKKIVDENDYSPKQIFNCDETGLFWKKMQARTYLAQDEAHASGFKPHKDRVTLLLAVMLMETLRIDLYWYIEQKNTRVLKSVKKSSLPVYWKAIRKPG